MWRRSGAGELGLKTVVVEKDPFLAEPVCTSGAFPPRCCCTTRRFTIISRMARKLGFEVSGLKIQLGRTSWRGKDKIVKKHAKGIEFLFKKNKVEWVQGWGRYEGPGKISVEKDGKKDHRSKPPTS